MKPRFTLHYSRRVVRPSLIRMKKRKKKSIGFFQTGAMFIIFLALDFTAAANELPI